MSDAFIDGFAQRLIESGIVSEDYPMVGCSETEIATLESKLRVTLPAIYRAYLAKMGKRPGDFLRGEECCYPDLLTLTSDGEEILEESETAYRLPPTAFVFWMSQGTQFSFF